MKPRSIGTFAALILIFSAVALAAPNKTTVNFSTPTVIGSYTLQPGEYAVQWTGSGPDVQVTFAKGNKIMWTVPAILDATHNGYNPSYTCHASESGATLLVEIKTKNATLRFLPSEMSSAK